MTLMSMAARMRPIATSTRMAVGVIALSLADQAGLRSGQRSYLHGDAR